MPSPVSPRILRNSRRSFELQEAEVRKLRAALCGDACNDWTHFIDLAVASWESHRDEALRGESWASWQAACERATVVLDLLEEELARLG